PPVAQPASARLASSAGNASFSFDIRGGLAMVILRAGTRPHLGAHRMNATWIATATFRNCDHGAMEFTDLPLAPALLPGLDAFGHTTLTPIQEQSLPALLAGRDVIAQAPTASGKTAAFGLGLLPHLAPAD